MPIGPQPGFSAFGASSAADLTALMARLTKDEQLIDQVQGRSIVSVGLSGSSLVFTHGDGAKHGVALPTQPSANIKDDLETLELALKQQGRDIDALKAAGLTYQHELKGLTGVYSYTGDSPVYPTEPKSAYVVNFNNINAREYAGSMPDVLTEDGTLFYFYNMDQDTKVVLRPVGKRALNNGDHYTIEPDNFVVFIQDKANYVKVASGLAPLSSDDLVNRVAQALAPQLHTEAELFGLFNTWLANPATQTKIKQIVSSSKPHQDTLVHIGLAQDYPTDFSAELGYFRADQALYARGMDKVAAKVWLAVPTAVADTVVGIRADGGLSATWDSKSISVNGKDWTVFLSPYKFHAASMEFTIEWSIK